MAESMDENWKYKIGKEDAERFIITGTYKSEITAAGNLGGKTKREKSGGNWPHVTIVLGRVTIKDDDGNELKTYQQVYRNREYHAEHYFLKALEENVKTLLSNNKVTKFSIQAKLVQNYSPCGDCAQKIINFRNEQKNQNINFSVEIKFANVYKHYEEANKGGLVALLKTDYVVLNLYQGKDEWKQFLNKYVNPHEVAHFSTVLLLGFHQDEDEDDWEKFLETYVNVHPDEKGELLRRARSEERKFNEQQGKEIFDDIIASGKLKAIRAILLPNKTNIGLHMHQS